MKLLLLFLLSGFSLVFYGQQTVPVDKQIISLQFKLPVETASIQLNYIDEVKKGKKTRIVNPEKWRLTKNKLITGGLVFLAGSAKGFNEALQFNYPGFKSIFPNANAQWFYPTLSFRNKYKDGDPEKGPRFPFSTSLLVMLTDQYHLNNFIQRASLTAALVIKIGDGKKPLKHYLLDALYYTATYQAGFHTIYYPIKMRNR